MKEVHKGFSDKDISNFLEPDEVCYPETWFHFVDGNVEKEGIRKDLEAIKSAGIRGVQFFHGGNFGGTWPGVEEPIYCLSEKWTDLLNYTARTADSLGLRFTMQVCPGWSMAGGPWIKPENAMRSIVETRADVAGGKTVSYDLRLANDISGIDSDYRDICVLAFPRPAGDTGKPLFELDKPIFLSPGDGPWTHDVEFDEPTAVRTLEVSNSQAMNQSYAYEPGCNIKVEAWCVDGSVKTTLDAPVPMSAWQVSMPSMTLALDEVEATKVRITVEHDYPITVGLLKLSSAARENGWEAKSARVLYAIPRSSERPDQNKESYIKQDGVIDITDKMDSEGHLVWDAPEGDWCILRIGHVNTRMENGPAPKEAVGWECDKLTPEGADAIFDNYIGKYEMDAVKGLLNGMLMDSWECQTQTWCRGMEEIFEEKIGYPLRPWLPALFGYVVGDQVETARFLLDWKGLINSLIVENFYGRMAERAHERGLNVQFETSGGDVYPCDPMEYFKFADVPMAEFWHHSTSDNFVGSINFKPVRPAASAGHIYGKTRISAEAFTSFWLTWDEHFYQLKENANRHMAQGITHEVFHTYTHNPNADTMVPGTSFGSNIGTPFLRGQTWWKYMPQFTKYLARCTYMLERGVPSMDVLWYLGDEIDHRPDQRPDYMPGYNYDYCNRDVLINRLKVKKGKVVTPEGLSYNMIWWPVSDYASPETVKKMEYFVRKGVVIVTDYPLAVSGKGKVYSGISIADALKAEGYAEDVRGGEGVDWLHRRTRGADWYFVAPKEGKDFKGSLDFRCRGDVEIWNPVDGSVTEAIVTRNGKRTVVELDLERAGCCFVVFRHSMRHSKPEAESLASVEMDLSEGWTLAFPEGWGAPASVALESLIPWKDIDMSSEGRSFSGTATYSKTFNLESLSGDSKIILDLGEVDMVADVEVNGQRFEPLWTMPYRLDISSAVKEGENEIKIDVTGTWFNRLVYDAGQEESVRKTWTIAGPSSGEALRPVGLLGPVRLIMPCTDAKSSDYSYHFDHPATKWEETLPLGNGRIGMMPDGGIDIERIVLNEISMWSGSRQNADNPEAGKYLDEIRELLFAGRNDEAQELVYKTFTCGGKGSGMGRGSFLPYGSYQLFGNLEIDYGYGAEAGVEDYCRGLDLRKAVARVDFTRGGTGYSRECFTSYCDDVGVIRLISDCADTMRISINREAETLLPEAWNPRVCLDGEDIIIRGRLNAGTETVEDTELNGTEFAGRVHVRLPRGGTLHNDGNSLVVENAPEVLVLVAMNTDYFGGNPERLCKRAMKAVKNKTFEELKADHIAAFDELFGRVDVDLGHNYEREILPIDRRLSEFAMNGDDPGLFALYYQYGRYLLISATRPGTLPPNLQGIWTNNIVTPWNGDFHLNINLQMNLWPAESGNLGELQLPLTDWILRQVDSGRNTARVFYGARGWVTHILGNPWEFTAPGEDPAWGATNTAAAWLCEHLYKHYLFSRDKAYLERVYPTMREAALFFVDMLVENPKTGYLVTAPTTSPENTYRLPNGKVVSICQGSTMDNQIIRELFTNVIAASKILDTDKEFADTLAEKCSRLMPTTIAEDGRVMEWLEPYEENEIHHRHVSHLYGLYPSNEISVANTPELASAARKTLEARGDRSTGWSMAWKANLWARLHDGEKAYKLLSDLLDPIDSTEPNYYDGGGSYPNLFCGHPPFQIDGNYGGAAGIAEMLLQSQTGIIEILPALPSEWRAGFFRGLCAEGGAELSVSWKDGEVTGICLTAKADGDFMVKGYMEEPVSLAKGQSWRYPQ